MWVSVTFAVVALSGAAFMIWVLVALRRENERTACVWIVAVHPRLNIIEALRDHEYGESRGGAEEEFEDRDYCVELLENGIHAKESSGLITLAIHSDTRGSCGRPKPARRASGAHQQRFIG